MRRRLASRAARGLQSAAFGYLLTALFAASVAVLAASSPGTSLPPRPAPRLAPHSAGAERPFAVALHPADARPRWVFVAFAARVLRLPVAAEAGPSVARMERKKPRQLATRAGRLRVAGGRAAALRHN